MTSKKGHFRSHRMPVYYEYEVVFFSGCWFLVFGSFLFSCQVFIVYSFCVRVFVAAVAILACVCVVVFFFFLFSSDFFCSVFECFVSTVLSFFSRDMTLYVVNIIDIYIFVPGTVFAFFFFFLPPDRKRATLPHGRDREQTASQVLARYRRHDPRPPGTRVLRGSGKINRIGIEIHNI